MTDYFASVIRTIVPIVVGVVTSWLARQGLNIEEAEITAWLTPTLIGGYYVAVRSLERKFPWLGWLLGLPKQPGYIVETRPLTEASPAPPEPLLLQNSEWPISMMTFGAGVALGANAADFVHPVATLNDDIDSQPDAPADEGDDDDHTVPHEEF